MPAVARKTTLETKEHILRAAQEYFAHYGFSKVTMDDIAGHVGLGKASLYYYFSTKEQLFNAVIMHEHQEFLLRINTTMQGNLTASEKIRCYVRERFVYFSTLLNLNILDLHSSVKMRPMLTKTFEEFGKQELKLLHTIFREGNERNEFDARPIDKIARGILHVMQGLRCRFLHTAHGPKIAQKQYHQLQEELAFITELLLRGIRRNGTRPSARHT